MIGMEDYSSGGLQNGALVQVLILSVGPTTTGEATYKAAQEHEISRAAALGTQPKDLVYRAKDYGLAVEYAVIASGDERIVTGTTGAYKLPNYSHTGKINQLPLTEVYTKSKALHDAGKEFGYNFQKQGGNNSLGTEGYPGIANLHPNPNIEKDWDSGVSALNVPYDQQEKFQDLLAKENDRKTKWTKIVDQWEALSPEQAEGELLEGLSRRLLLFCKRDAKKLVYAAPKPGIIFQAKVVRKDDSKYFDLAFFEYDKSTKKYICFADTEKDCSFVFDEETVLMAEEIKSEIDRARQAFKAKQAATPVATATSTDDEWE